MGTMAWYRSSNRTVVLCWIFALFLVVAVRFETQTTLGFTEQQPFPNRSATAANDSGSTTRLFASTGDDEEPSSSTPRPFAVLKKIAGVNWEGSCRYVNQDLVPASFKLSGGIRFDLVSDGEEDVDKIVELNSFIVFPNGKSREIQMRYVHFDCCERRYKNTHLRASLRSRTYERFLSN